MRRWDLRWLVGSLLLLAALPGRAHAVRPFVTDDARIVDYGQLELESWADIMGEGGAFAFSLNVMGGVTVTDWLEVIVGAGMGFDLEGAFSITNPVIQPKLLLVPARPDGSPGVAFVAGVTLPFGTGGLFDDAVGWFAMFPFTTRLFQDRLLVHVNFGVRGGVRRAEGRDEVSARPYWGVGFDAALGLDELRLIGEAYAGDPLEVPGADYAFQWGLRWLHSDYVNIDLTFGTQPVHGHPGGDELAFWGQIGLRLLADAFTRDGRPGSALGARGLLPDPQFDAERTQSHEGE